MVIRFSKTIIHSQEETFSVSHRVAVDERSVPSGFCLAKTPVSRNCLPENTYYMQQNRSFFSNAEIILPLLASTYIHRDGEFQ
jgi:hypothetical protein